MQQIFIVMRVSNACFWVGLMRIYLCCHLMIKKIGAIAAQSISNIFKLFGYVIIVGYIHYLHMQLNLRVKIAWLDWYHSFDAK